MRDHPFGRDRTRFGERRALSGVVAAFEFAVGALEVVLVEAALVDDPPVIVDLVHVKMSRLVSGVVRPAAPEQMQALTADGQRARLEVRCTARKMRSTSAAHRVWPPMGSPLSRR